MKIAIAGATLSGIACAVSLEQKGLTYDLFDRNHCAGSPFPFTSVWLNNHRDNIDYLKEVQAHTGITLRPLAAVKRLVVTTPEHDREYNGNIGWIMENGQAAGSLIGQIAAQMQGIAQCSMAVDLDYMTSEYQAVAACEAAGDLSGKNGSWISQGALRIRGMIVLGNFDANTVYLRSNMTYCPGGLVYMIPFREKRMCIALCIPNATSNQADRYWNTFLHEAHIRWKAIEAFEYVHQIGRLAKAAKQPPLFYAESGSGWYDPFMGWGQAEAIINGFKTGLAIAEEPLAQDDMVSHGETVVPLAPDRLTADQAGRTNSRPVLHPLQLIEQAELPGRESVVRGPVESEANELSAP